MSEAVYFARSFGAGFIPLGFSAGSIVGTNPLDTIDGDTSYVEVGAGEFDQSAVTFQFEKVSGDIPPNSPTLEMRLAVDVTYTTSKVLYETLPVLLLSVYAISHGGRTRVTESSQPETYTTYYDLPAALGDGVVDGFGPDILAAFLTDPAQFWTLFTTQPARGHVGGSVAARVTYLRAVLTWGGDEFPLRLMQRSDRLGMGSGRLLGVGTRQNSTRLFGTP